MSNTKHTKGPWYYVEIEKTIYHDDEFVCEFDEQYETDINANAQLIVAAPDLLAACEIVFTNLNEFRDDNVYVKAAFDAAFAAILKAKGDSNE